MNYLVLLVALLFAAPALAQAKIDAVLVKKSERTLYLLRDGQVVKRYRIMLGPHAKGPKLLEGDERTPEGNYTARPQKSQQPFLQIDSRVVSESAAIVSARRNTTLTPGGSIMIHAHEKEAGTKKPWRAPRKFNWTDGCIAVKNSDMDEIWDAIEIGTPIEIQP